jgi:hypothetical protein
MERVLWCLSLNWRPSLPAGESSPTVETLIWTIKSWWGVMGVQTGTRTQMARALAEKKLFAMSAATARDCTWFGAIEQQSPLRALNKVMWWVGGGSTGAAAVVRNPCQVTGRLNLSCP